MKHVMLSFVVSLCIVSPARAQSRLYTNADLGRPLDRTRTSTAEEMQGLLAHQFTLSPKRDEPKAFVLPYDPSWPFTYSQRLEPDPWRTPGWWPLYGTWSFYGSYPFNPFAIYSRPYAFATCCNSKPHVRDAPPGAVDLHRTHGEHR